MSVKILTSCDFYDFSSGKGVKTSAKTTVRQSKQTSVPVRPFAGKVFYLDLQSNRTAEILERDIKELGGVSKNLHWYHTDFYLNIGNVQPVFSTCWICSKVDIFIVVHNNSSSYWADVINLYFLLYMKHRFIVYLVSL